MPQQMINHWGIVKETMNVGTYTMIRLQDGFVCIAHTLMNLIALTRLSIELESYLTCGLLCGHRGMDRQNAKSRQTRNAPFDTIRIIHRLSQHLIATTNANNHFSLSMGTLYRLGTTIPS